MPTNQQKPLSRKAMILPPVLAAVAAAVVWWRLDVSRPGVPATETTFTVFATSGNLKLWGPDEKTRAATEAILTRLREIHRRINVFNEDSELSRVNRMAEERPVHCSKLVWDMLLEARRAYKITDGAFDVTVGPLMEIWGFRSKRERLPSPQKIRSTRQATGFDKVVLNADNHTVRFKQSGVYLDFGGIAKGYALDMAARIAADHGIRRGIINIGGNVRCLERPPPGRKAYRVAIRNPLHPEQLLGYVKVTDCSISSSGNYENYRTIDSQKVGHIVDPRTGRPVEHLAGVTVITGKGVDSDIFSTAVFVDGRDMIDNFNKHCQPAGVFMVKPSGQEGPDIKKYGWQWTIHQN